MKPKILTTAIQVLCESGLSAWSVEAVARDAGCAKGLVHYHFRTKAELLARVAEAIGARQHFRRLEAFRAEGTPSLDRLWEGIVEEVRSGEFGAWLALVAHPDPEVRKALRPSQDEMAMIGAAAIRALDLDASAPSVGRLLIAGIHGLQITLLRGEQIEGVHEAYHRFWLGVIG